MLANYSIGKDEDVRPVGSYREGVSRYRIYDMSGNVWEWTRSRNAPLPNASEFRYPYRPGELDRERLVDDGTYRILRGGSYANAASAAPATARMPADPDLTGRATGLRLAISCAGG